MIVDRTFHVDIVSAEGELFNGSVKKLFATGIMGELEILYGHAPLLTLLVPGPVWLEHANGEQEGLVVFGGVLEVQNHIVIILADAALRAKDIDEAAAASAKVKLEHAFEQGMSAAEYDKIKANLAVTAAQLKLIKKIKGAKK